VVIYTLSADPSSGFRRGAAVVSRNRLARYEKEPSVKDDPTIAAIAALLHQVGEVHHIVFADTDGNDDDWATFYSDWLLAHSTLPSLLGERPIRSHLTRDLVDLDEEYATEKRAEQWPVWYAARLAQKYG
jgi:hypothetical protein